VKEYAIAIVDVLLENDEFSAQVSAGEQECAWCNEERGRPPTPGASHGICMRHYTEVLREQGLPEQVVQARVQAKLAAGTQGAPDQGAPGPAV
jgi:hypothetical protein